MQSPTSPDLTTLNESINIFLYAKKLNIKKVCKNGKFSHKVQIYLLETNPNILQWLSENKKFPSSRIFISNIMTISTTPPYQLSSKKFNLEGILSIQYKEKGFLVLEFEKKEERILWEQGLSYFVRLAKENQFEDVNLSPKSNKSNYQSLAARLFDQQDQQKSGILNFPEIQQICQQLHLRLSPKFLHPLFTKFSDGEKISKENFERFVWECQIKPELRDLFERYCPATKDYNYSPNEPVMTCQDFLGFCQHEQFEFNVGLEQVSDLMEMFNSLENPQEKNISLVTFCTIIFNQVNSIFDSKKKMIYQNMTWPLNQYFIKSTNFKLLTNATKHQCINQYINVLKFGYRYIEIDIWEGPHGEPSLFPEINGTFIPCEAVIEAIANFGFESNSYPLIIGLNVQCGEIQQDRLAEILQQYFGDMLYTLPQGCWDMENPPSPEELQNKIILHSYGYFSQACQQLQGQFIDTVIEDKKFEKFGSKGVSNHLLKLLTLFGQKIGLNKPSTYNYPFALNCLATKKLNKLLSSKESQLIEYNKKNMTKITPFAGSQNNENFSIFDGFLAGAQISCIGDNSNEMDLYYYESKFQENGGINSGYVLKPYFMRPEQSETITPSKDFQEVQQEIMLNIISAHQLIVPEEKQQEHTFELEVSVINGKDQYQGELKAISDKVASDGVRVELKNFTVKFPICCPELSMILFKMKYEEGIMGFYGIPVQCVRSGYRMIPLRNPTNLEIMENCSIFAYVICKELK